MQIGELSRKSGFSRDTIRYYEKLGLISFDDKRTHTSGYKDYPEEVLKRLLAIKKIKDYGFTLEETRGLFILFEEGVLEHDRGVRYLRRKISLIDKKISELQQIRSRLVAIADEKAGDCSIQRILLEMSADKKKAVGK
jgi:DNA-binding transcriptional MerR regulator